MKIRSLHLKNYRCFENFDIDFDERLTVLIGLNGAGKTSTLDALRLFWGKIGHPNTKKHLLVDMPASNVAVTTKSEKVIYNVECSCPGNAEDTLDDLDFVSERQGNNSTLLHLNQSDRQKLQVKWQHLVQSIDTENSLFVAYMAGRFISENAHRLNNVHTISSQTAAFDNAFNRTIDYTATLVWFNNMDADEARAMRDKGQ